MEVKFYTGKPVYRRISAYHIIPVHISIPVHIYILILVLLSCRFVFTMYELNCFERETNIVGVELFPTPSTCRCETD